MREVPRLNATYWMAITLASVVGANAGDYLAEAMGLGHLKGLPWLAALLAVVLLGEAFLGVASVACYWAAILVVRAAATNIGDVFHDVHVGFAVSLPAAAVLLAGWVVMGRTRYARALESGSVPVNASYWLAMFLAGVLGTLLGDWASFGLQLFPAKATVVLGTIYLIALLASRRLGLGWVAWFWLSIALVRGAGTAAGDGLAHALGLGTSTAITSALFVVLVGWWYRKGAGNEVSPGLPPSRRHARL